MVAQISQVNEGIQLLGKTDLRKVDEEEFIKIFEYLKERTYGFRELPPELVLENNQYLLPIRLCLGMSQMELARELGVTKEWVRHTEAGRNKIIHLTIANRYIYKIESLLAQKEILLQKALECFRRYNFSRDQDLPSIKVRLKPFRQMNEEDFREYFELIRHETSKFTKFYPQLFVRIPQSLMILRMVLGINHRRFAKILGTSGRVLRAYEHLETQVKTPTANKFVEIIKQLFDGKTITLRDALDNFRWLSGMYGRSNLGSYIERGLNSAQNKAPNELEQEIETLLKMEGIPFVMHARVRGLKREYNADFVIPDARDPKVIIEVIKSEVVSGKKGNYRYRICLTDHKFQMIKLRYKNIITVLIINCDSPHNNLKRVEKTIGERVRGMIEIETLNTDLFALTKDETMGLIQKLKSILV